MQVKQRFQILLVPTGALLSILLSSFLNFRTFYLLLALLIGALVLYRFVQHKLVFITVALLPFVYVPLELTGGKYISFTHLLLAFTILLALRYRLLSLKFDGVEACLVFFALWICIRLIIMGNVVQGVSLFQSFDLLTSDISKIFSGFILYRLAKTIKFERSIALGLVFVVLITTGVQVYQMQQGAINLINIGYTTPTFNFNTASGDMRPFSTFVTPVAYGIYLATILSFLFWSKVRFKWVILVIGVAAVIGTETRSAWVAFALSSFFVALITFRKYQKQIALASIGVLVTSLFLFTYAPQTVEGITSRISTLTDTSYSSNSIRLHLWQGTLKASTEHLVIGHGQHNFTETLTKYIPYDEAKLAHPHQTFLDILLKYGLMGLAAYSAIFIAFFRTVAKSKKNHMTYASLAAVLTFIVGSMFETMSSSYNIFIAVMLLMGFARNPLQE